ncbi:DUF1758 domain-containing protein [Trichonephila clavipes]|nr:DUF1758 domain-containing protein [Trichonephila clavipes]
MKIGSNGNLVLGPFDESTPCLMIVLMNCQTKLRINHLTAVKSVAILERFDSNSQVLLCTALVNVCDSFGGTRLCRVLLDPGSQACLITSSCLERLGLPRKRTNVRISCLGASDTRTNGISEIKFTPHFTSNISFVTSVYVVNKIVGQLPHFSLDSSWSEPFSDLNEERACEDHFLDTHVRNEDGRYVVRLPFHSSPSKLEIRENQLFEDSNH